VSPDAEGDFLVRPVHAEDHRAHLVADLEHRRRAFDLLAGDLGDVDQPLDPVGDLDERTEVVTRVTFPVTMSPFLNRFSTPATGLPRAA